MKRRIPDNNSAWIFMKVWARTAGGSRFPSFTLLPPFNSPLTCSKSRFLIAVKLASDETKTPLEHFPRGEAYNIPPTKWAHRVRRILTSLVPRKTCKKEEKKIPINNQHEQGRFPDVKCSQKRQVNELLNFSSQPDGRPWNTTIRIPNPRSQVRGDSRFPRIRLQYLWIYVTMPQNKRNPRATSPCVCVCMCAKSHQYTCVSQFIMSCVFLKLPGMYSRRQQFSATPLSFPTGRPTY